MTILSHNRRLYLCYYPNLNSASLTLLFSTFLFLLLCALSSFCFNSLHSLSFVSSSAFVLIAYSFTFVLCLFFLHPHYSFFHWFIVLDSCLLSSPLLLFLFLLLLPPPHSALLRRSCPPRRRYPPLLLLSPLPLEVGVVFNFYDNLYILLFIIILYFSIYKFLGNYY